MSDERDSKLLMWFLTFIGGFALICMMLTRATDSFREITDTAWACVLIAGFIAVVTSGFLKEGSRYTPKVHFFVVCVLVALISLKTKFSM